MIRKKVLEFDHLTVILTLYEDRTFSKIDLHCHIQDSVIYTGYFEDDQSAISQFDSFDFDSLAYGWAFLRG